MKAFNQKITVKAKCQKCLKQHTTENESSQLIVNTVDLLKTLNKVKT